MSRNAEYWIHHLALEAHPEGGYYRQTYRAELSLPKQTLPVPFKGPRAVSTAIYFLLERGDFSAFHRLQSDELWHFYVGGSVAVHVIEPDGGYSLIKLGGDHEVGEQFQGVVRAGCWFASHLVEGGGENDAESFALVGCTVAPGFDFEDFELATREGLGQRYPEHRLLIDRLTRR